MKVKRGKEAIRGTTIEASPDFRALFNKIIDLEGQHIFLLML